MGVYSGHCFFFSSRRRHTRFDCDWSSDVCSSDLASSRAWPTPTFARGSTPPGSTRVRTASSWRRSEEHTSELQSQSNLVCRLLLEKKNKDVTSMHLKTHQIRARIAPRNACAPPTD